MAGGDGDAEGFALVVEDDGLVARMASVVLEADGWAVESVRTAAMAEARIGIGWADGNPVDLLVVDLSLPDSSGIETVERLRRLDPYAALLVYTGDSSAETEIALAGAADAFVRKSEPTRRLQIGARVARARADRRGAIVEAFRQGMDEAVAGMREGGTGGG